VPCGRGENEERPTLYDRRADALMTWITHLRGWHALAFRNGCYLRSLRRSWAIVAALIAGVLR